MHLRPSRLLVLWLLFVHLIAAAGLVASALGLPVKLLLAGALAVSCAICTSRELNDYGAKVVQLRGTTAGNLELILSDGTIYQAEIMSESRILGPLTLLAWRTADAQCRRIVLLPDSTDADSTRLLRVWMRQAPRAQSTPDPIAQDRVAGDG